MVARESERGRPSGRFMASSRKVAKSCANSANSLRPEPEFEVQKNRFF